MEVVSGVPFCGKSTQTKAVFSSFSRPENAFLIERIVGRVRARALLPTYGARYLFGGNHGRNFVSMGIVWQQVGKISTHRATHHHSSSISPPLSPTSPRHIVLHGNTISFSPAIFRPCFPMPRMLASNQFAIPRENRIAREIDDCSQNDAGIDRWRAIDNRIIR